MEELFKFCDEFIDWLESLNIIFRDLYSIRPLDGNAPPAPLIGKTIMVSDYQFQRWRSDLEYVLPAAKKEWEELRQAYQKLSEMKRSTPAEIAEAMKILQQWRDSLKKPE